MIQLVPHAQRPPAWPCPVPDPTPVQLALWQIVPSMLAPRSPRRDQLLFMDWMHGLGVELFGRQKSDLHTVHMPSCDHPLTTRPEDLWLRVNGPRYVRVMWEELEPVVDAFAQHAGLSTGTISLQAMARALRIDSRMRRIHTELGALELTALVARCQDRGVHSLMLRADRSVDVNPTGIDPGVADLHTSAALVAAGAAGLHALHLQVSDTGVTMQLR